jgi:hypothetical protein
MSWSTSRPSDTRAARRMRARVLREEPVCGVPGCGRPSIADDHIVGWAEREVAGLTPYQWAARENHQGLCGEHHDAKTRAERARGRERRKQANLEPHPGVYH